MTIPSDVFRLTQRGTLPSGEVFAWSYYVQPDAPITSQSAFQSWLDTYIAAASYTDNIDVFRKYLPAAASYTEVDGYYYAGGTGAQFQANAAYAGAGLGVDKGMPDQCALCLTLLTGAPGRSRRGRVYIPFINSGNMTDDSQVINATLEEAVTALANLLNTAGDQSAQAVVVSETQTEAHAITVVRGDSVVDTQRRRRNKQAPANTYQLSL